MTLEPQEEKIIREASNLNSSSKIRIPLSSWNAVEPIHHPFRWPERRDLDDDEQESSQAANKVATANAERFMAEPATAATLSAPASRLFRGAPTFLAVAPRVRRHRRLRRHLLRLLSLTQAGFTLHHRPNSIARRKRAPLPDPLRVPNAVSKTPLAAVRLPSAIPAGTSRIVAQLRTSSRYPRSGY